MRTLVLVLLSLNMLSGCVPILVGGAATGAALAHDKRTAGTLVEDEAIEDKALVRLARDRDFYHKIHINVTSYNMRVLVTGEAPDEASRQRVFELVRGIPKVRQVYNEITIGPPTSVMVRNNDTWLTTKVKSNLLRIKDMDTTHVKVVTEKGVVYLMGFLKPQEGDAVANLTRKIGGVRKVVKLFETPAQP
jgi:osmotically-inducible protein OsmY